MTAGRMISKCVIVTALVAAILLCDAERMKSLLEARITSFAASGKGQDYGPTNTKVVSPWIARI